MKKLDLQKLKGLDVDSARSLIKEHDLVSRVVEHNGKQCIVTADFRTDRVSLYIKNNLVIKASFNG